MSRETPFCPTCGRPNPIKQSPEWLLTRFVGIYGNVIAHLIQCRREKRAASLRELCEAAYVDRAGGMPVNAIDNVKATLSNQRPALNEWGWDIVGPHVTGAGFHLVTLEPN